MKPRKNYQRILSKASTFIGCCTLILFFTLKTFAQSPQAIPYQAVARNAGGMILSNQNMAVRISLIDSNSNTIDYQEVHAITTNAYGLFTLQIGEGAPQIGSMMGIPWSNKGNEHIKVDIDTAGGTNFIEMGITALSSVPFSLHANTSGDNKWNTNGTSIYNNNNGNVGIGTSNPETSLQVTNPNSSSKVTIGAGNTNYGTTNLMLGTTSYSNGQSEIQSIAQSGIAWGNLLLNPYGGNIGIGVTNPDAPLHIMGGVHLNANNYQGGAGIMFDEAPYAGNGHWVMDAYAAGFPPANKLRIYNDRTGITVHTIMDNGNVGIGDFQYWEKALAKLDVKGNMKLVDGTQGVGKVLTSDADGYASWQTFTESEPKVGNLSLNKIPHWNGTSLSDGAITEVSGNVGIGIANPDAPLHILGGLHLNANNYQGGDGIVFDEAPYGGNGHWISEAYAAGFPVANKLRTYNDRTGITVQTIMDNGNFGIGDFQYWESALAKLDVKGNMKLADGTQGVGKVLTSDADGFASWQTPLETDPKLGILSLNKFPYWNGSTLTDGTMTQVGGNIGIGISNPDAPLHILGGIHLNANNYQGGDGIVFDEAPYGGNGHWITEAYAAGSPVANKLRTYNDRTGITVQTIMDNGNVGIGDFQYWESALAKLDVKGNIKIADGTQGAGKILTSDADGVATWQSPSSNNIGCVIRAQSWTANAIGSSYTSGMSFAPATITTTGIYGDTRLINSGAYQATTGNTSTTGVFTAPSDGYYEVSVKAISVASNVRLLILASLNGTTPTEILDMLTTNPCANCSDISHTQVIYLQAGDTHRILRSASSASISDMIISYRKL